MSLPPGESPLRVGPRPGEGAGGTDKPWSLGLSRTVDPRKVSHPIWPVQTLGRGTRAPRPLHGVWELCGVQGGTDREPGPRAWPFREETGSVGRTVGPVDRGLPSGGRGTGGTLEGAQAWPRLGDCPPRAGCVHKGPRCWLACVPWEPSISEASSEASAFLVSVHRGSCFLRARGSHFLPVQA